MSDAAWSEDLDRLLDSLGSSAVHLTRNRGTSHDVLGDALQSLSSSLGGENYPHRWVTMQQYSSDLSDDLKRTFVQRKGVRVRSPVHQGHI